MGNVPLAARELAWRGQVGDVELLRDVVRVHE